MKKAEKYLEIVGIHRMERKLTGAVCKEDCKYTYSNMQMDVNFCKEKPKEWC